MWTQARCGSVVSARCGRRSVELLSDKQSSCHRRNSSSGRLGAQGLTVGSAILAGNVDAVSMGLREKPQYANGKWFDMLEQSVRGWRIGNLKIDNEGFDRRNYITILGMLLEHDVNPNLRNPRDERFNFTILHHLAGNGCNPITYGHTEDEVVEFARLLLNHGARHQCDGRQA